MSASTALTVLHHARIAAHRTTLAALLLTRAKLTAAGHEAAALQLGDAIASHCRAARAQRTALLQRTGHEVVYGMPSMHPMLGADGHLLLDCVQGDSAAACRHLTSAVDHALELQRWVCHGYEHGAGGDYRAAVCTATLTPAGNHGTGALWLDESSAAAASASAPLPTRWHARVWHTSKPLRGCLSTLLQLAPIGRFTLAATMRAVDEGLTEGGSAVFERPWGSWPRAPAAEGATATEDAETPGDTNTNTTTNLGPIWAIGAALPRSTASDSGAKRTEMELLAAPLVTRVRLITLLLQVLHARHAALQLACDTNAAQGSWAWDIGEPVPLPHWSERQSRLRLLGTGAGASEGDGGTPMHSSATTAHLLRALARPQHLHAELLHLLEVMNVTVTARASRALHAAAASAAAAGGPGAPPALQTAALTSRLARECVDSLTGLAVMRSAAPDGAELITVKVQDAAGSLRAALAQAVAIGSGSVGGAAEAEGDADSHWGSAHATLVAALSAERSAREGAQDAAAHAQAEVEALAASVARRVASAVADRGYQLLTTVDTLRRERSHLAKV